MLTDEVEKLSALLPDEDFVIQAGFAFRKGPDGKYAPGGYCPNCYLVMSINL